MESCIPFSAIIEFFKTTFDAEPTSVARSPGRLNIIGEHTDYNGFGCFAFPLPQDFRVAARLTSEPLLRLALLPGTHADADAGIVSGPVDADPMAASGWTRYVLAALADLRDRGLLPASAGVDIVGGGTIPPAAGLSSSSAITTATYLAILRASAPAMSTETSEELLCGVPRSWLASQAIHTSTELALAVAAAERRVGTAGGALDHATMICASADTSAVALNFPPQEGGLGLTASPVPIPAGFVFLFAHSLTECDKSATALDNFNARVAACRLAALLLTKGASGYLAAACEAPRRPMDARPTLARLPETASVADVEAVVGAEAVARVFTGGLAPWREDETRRTTALPLRKRAEHVLTEAGRVACVISACGEAAEATDDPEGARLVAANAIAAGMRMSHFSCATKYEISTPDVDALVRTAEEGGAAAARICGAGFGGSVLVFVPEADTQGCIDHIVSQFYAKRLAEGAAPPITVVTGVGAGAVAAAPDQIE